MTSRESSTLEDIDPSVAWLQKMTMTGPNDRSPSPEIPEPGGIHDFGHESDNEADEITPERSGSGTSGIASMSSSAVIELCRLLKRRKNFRPESEADLDAFAADNLRTYATAFLLCLTLSTYRGKVVGKLIEALRKLAVAQLPPIKETSQVKLVHSRISGFLTTARNVVKTQLKASIDDPANKGNIADLANAVIGRTGFKPTVQVYMRIAFLRWHMLNYPDLSPEDWWIKVDETMLKWWKQLATEVKISEAFTKMYNEDKTRFGDPVDSGRTTSEIRELENWQVVLQTHAKNVEPSKAKNLKRKNLPS